MRINCAVCAGAFEPELATRRGQAATRLALGLSLKEAAEGIGVTSGALCNYEHGRGGLGEHKVERYRRWLRGQLYEAAA